MSNKVCISGDAIVRTSKNKISVMDIHRLFILGKDIPMLKTFDKSTMCFIYSKCEDIIETIPNSVLEITTLNKRVLKLGSNSSILTRNGFIKIKDLSIDSFLATNGVPCYQNKLWLENAKREAILNKGGLTSIAEKANISYHTIRKWLRFFGIQFTKTEVASYNTVWNKGLPSELQPMYGNVHSDETRIIMKDSSLSGSNSPLWKGGVERGFRQEVFDWQYKYHNRLMKDYEGKCKQCSSQIDLEIDHIKPVKVFPELAFDYSNLQLLCSCCHKKKSAVEYSESPNYSKVKTIRESKSEPMYTLTFKNTDNFIANGLIVS
jgi:thymidylate synthase (FAD)